MKTIRDIEAIVLDFENPTYLFNQTEIDALWEFLKWQHLPYHNEKLQLLAKQIGEVANDILHD